MFEVVDSNGEVDETIHDDDDENSQFHTLTIKLESKIGEQTIHPFRHGRCIVPAILLPKNEGSCCFLASHSRHPELHLSFKVAMIFLLLFLN